MPVDDGFYDAGDEAAVDAQRSEAARRDAEDDETIRVWMNHPKGRDLLYRIVFQVCHHAETYIAADEKGRTDTHRTFLSLGERNIGNWFDDRLRRHPALYMEMLREQEIERELRNTKLLKQNEKQDERNG